MKIDVVTRCVAQDVRQSVLTSFAVSKIARPPYVVDDRCACSACWPR